MDFGKEAIEKVEQLIKNGLTVEVDGRTYSAARLQPVLFEPEIQPVSIATLTGFVDFINTNVDGEDLKNYIVVIDNCNSISLVSKLQGENQKRIVLLDASLDKNMETFPFDRFLEQEDFIIKLHSLFEKKEGDDFDYVAQMVSKIVQADSADTEDDGITQHVTVRKGVSGALTEKGTIKHIVRLSPYRTFREIEQIESQFLLRIEAKDGKVKVALFEADGGSWRNDARLRIAEFLKTKITVPVIA